MLSDLSSRIKRAKERLALTQEKEERYREQMAQQAEGTGGMNKVWIYNTRDAVFIKIFPISQKITI